MAENTPGEVAAGQTWSIWVPARSQWLLATVARREGHQATLKYDLRYGVAKGQDEQRADVAAMLTNTNLFRFLASRD